MEKIKWFAPENEDGSSVLKQHAFVPATCKERYTRDEYPGNKSLCGIGFISEDGEYAQKWEDIEQEIFNENNACKKCLKLSKWN